MGSITGTVVAGNGTDASSIYTSIHHFNETTIIIMRGTVCSHDQMNGCACAKRIRVYLLSEGTLATLLPESFTVDENLIKYRLLFMSLLGLCHNRHARYCGQHSTRWLTS